LLGYPILGEGGFVELREVLAIPVERQSDAAEVRGLEQFAAIG
jgi:hypothetical protein